MEQDSLVDENFPLFSKSKTKPKPKPISQTTQEQDPNFTNEPPQLEKFTVSTPNSTTAAATATTTFADLGLADWAVETCKELGMRRPTPVQAHCIPKILEGRDVLGLAQTGSGKTAAFALPILQRLAEEPYGVLALVMTPTRELAFQLAEQFKALGSCLHLRCEVVVGGMDMLNQAKGLMNRPHVVIATPGRIKVLLEEDPDIPQVFSRTKERRPENFNTVFVCVFLLYLGSFLVLDEADRVLDAGFEEELRVVFQCLPKNRQTLLFSATMTSDLQTLLELSANKAFFYEAYEGFKTVETLKQQYIFIPKNVKDVYLVHILSKMEDMGVRSAIIFVSTCRSCHLLSLLLEELEQEAAALHSFKSQSSRLSALHRFKSGQATILLATDVASRGLDIPTNLTIRPFQIPERLCSSCGAYCKSRQRWACCELRYPNLGILQNDVDLVHEIEAVIGKQLEEFECKEKDVLSDITRVYKARRVATMKSMDDGFEEKAKERKKQKLKTLAEKGLLKKKNKKRKRSVN
ncbi:hypothetical protein Patl1_20811 [Pistacia atlantica]|uniref:Uncharacterized protein n=1 Tax=Pistacia atlantica TaxID=434234 RepID=A0ACC1BI46_9ROSI|nr:hypothetical protein Patl1_20811 [Pistacia atlantica]